VKRWGASAEDIVGALLLPSPRVGRHDGSVAAGTRTRVRLPRQRSAGAAALVPTGLSDDAERRLARLAGVDTLPPVTVEPDPTDVVAVRPGAASGVRPDSAEYSHRLLRVAQIVALGGLFLIAAAAMLSARFGNELLRVHPLAFAGWGLGATLAAITLASLATDPTLATTSTLRRESQATLLLLGLITCVSGVVTSAGGVAGPAWVLFFPVVLVCGAVVGPVRGLVIGALAAAGLYVSAALSDTLTAAGAGRLVVILPAFPAAGWAAGALARLAREAALDAASRRAALERDVSSLAEVLASVARGDLSRVPAPGEGADVVATSLAVVFADTLLALRRLVRQMDSVAEQVANSAFDMSSTAEQHVAAVEAQTAAVAETTSTVEQLAATAGSIAEIAVRVSQFAGSTRRDVDAGATAVRAAGDAMDVIAARVGDLASRTDALRERIGRVGEATRLIDEISRRTTILAVNASIEAARAGEFGQGFATVASEVNTLAERAREATAQIGAILDELERQAADTATASEEGLVAVEVGTELQGEVVDSLRRITAMVDRTTAAAREISEATRQQRFASDAVVTAMATVTTSSERYRSGSRGHAVAARRLNELAEGLKLTLSRFKVI
jgi:methyl-accepting chemotaxis protein